MSGADPLELAAVARAAHVWASSEPLNEQQAAAVAALLRESRPGSAADLLMARLGFRHVVPLRPGTSA